MILDRFVLHNFGPYLGRHEIDLSPIPPKKPVILFGGMNGGGKTSILNALQVVLYGRRSDTWKGSENSYDAFLRKCVHRRADPEEGAGIELTFRSSLQGAEQTIHLSRYWRVVGSSIRESLDVIRDGELDTVLAENWAEWVEEFIPARVAPLFFFDGEKIEAMASPAKSAEILKAAIHSLLGLDIVDQLKTDLEILERRKRKESGIEKNDSPLVQKARDLERDHDKQEERLGQRHQALAVLRNDSERLTKRLSDLERQLEKQGGAIFESRHKFESDRDALLKTSRGLEDELRVLAAGGLPLTLVLPMLGQMEEAAKSTHDTAVQATVLEVLQQRDDHLLERIRALRAPKGLLAGVSAFLDEDRKQRTVAGPDEAPALDRAELARVHALRSHVLPTEQARVGTLLKKLDDVELRIQNLERKLAGLPDEEKILPLLQERDGLREEIAQVDRKQEALLEALRIDTAEHERCKKDLDAARQSLAETMLDDEDTKRLLQHSLKARNTLDQFRRKVLHGHVQRIEKLALECFATLMRKQHLVRDLRIDADSFEVTLQGEAGEVVPADKLSAGERQLLAIGLLWGLGRASGRPLPTVIDTPLGRLDSSHRQNLIDRYFPFASHQVILLSTDEEIDQGYHRKLDPHIARSYLLDFDDRKQVTTVQDGYFWEIAS